MKFYFAWQPPENYFSPFDTRQICRSCADIAGLPFYKRRPFTFCLRAIIYGRNICLTGPDWPAKWIDHSHE
jgi:hypothetical protein